MVSVAVFNPRAPGWKRTVRFTLPPGFTVRGSAGGETRLNAEASVPETVKELTINPVFPVFWIVSGRSELESTSTEPNPREPGDVPMIGAAWTIAGNAMQSAADNQRVLRCTLNLLHVCSRVNEST